MIKYLFILMLVFFSCQPKQDVPIEMELHKNWQFKNIKDNVWLNATIPGNVHTDLLDNKIIENPFIGNNEIKLQWISENDWEYKTQFSLDEEVLQKNILNSILKD